MSWLSAIGNLFGGSDNSGSSSGGGGGWVSNIFGAILGGIGASGEQDDALELLEEGAEAKGEQDRRSLEFGDKLEYYRSQQRRHETSRALDSAYNQFSTVRNFAPNYVRGTGLDALPAYPEREPEDD